MLYDIEKNFEYVFNLFETLKIPEDEHISQQYWYFVHKVVQRVKAGLLTLAALEIQLNLPVDISYKSFLEDCKKHKDWKFKTRNLTQVIQRIKNERANVTRIIIDDIIKMQIEMGFPIHDEIIKFDSSGKKVGLSRKPSSRKLKMLGKQLGLGELFIIYQTTVYSYRDLSQPNDFQKAMKFDDDLMKRKRKRFNKFCPEEKLKNSLIEHVCFNDALLRFWEIIDGDEPVFANTLTYLVDLYINDNSWWFWRDEYSFLLNKIKNVKAKNLHNLAVTNISENVIAQIDRSSKEHIISETRELKKFAALFSKTKYNSFSEYMKSKFYKF